MKTYAYIRTATGENFDTQIADIKEFARKNNIVLEDIVVDRASGNNFNREGYQKLKNQLLCSGDTLVIKELARLGRNVDMLKNEWAELQKKGIGIIIIDNPMLSTAGKSDSEKKLVSNIIFEMLSYMAEKEESVREKKKLGRPEAEFPSNWNEIYAKWKAKEITAVKAMELMQLKKNSFYNLVRKHENK